jgi:NADH-quinone oxidoreductase subunit N
VTVDQTLQQVFQLVVPEAVLVGTACVLFLLSTFTGISRSVSGGIALLGLALALLIHCQYRFDDTTRSQIQQMSTVSPLLSNALSDFMRLAALATGAILILFTWKECDETRAADYFACLLIATAGFSLIGAANDLIILFLALELISIPTYVMLYLPKAKNAKGQEAAIKYFMLSVMSSAFMLFGFSYLYGITGSTNLGAISELLPRAVAGDMSISASISLVMILAGLGYKVTAFPFHFYAPDVYQGGSTGTVAFLAFVPKIAGFVALIKLFAFIGAAHPVANEFVKRSMMLVWILSVVTMTAGNVMGLLQNDLRRMLAYSGVANAGYMLMGLAVLPAQAYRSDESASFATGGEALLFYLIAYGAMTIGAFAILAYLGSTEKRVETIDDVAGIGQTHPLASLLLSIFLISMIGLPLTAGFVGKFYLFFSAMAAPSTAPMLELFRVLALVGAINAAIAAFYYVRVLMAMYQRTALHPPTPKPAPWLLAVAVVCAVLTLGLGVYPKPVLDAARASIQTVLG